MDKEMTCEMCEEFVPIGGGDHICLKSQPPKMVLEDYIPTDEYLWCQMEEAEDECV